MSHFLLKAVGLSIVNGLLLEHPLMGLSIHGKDVLEIKCPFFHRESTIQSAAMDKKFCLKESGDKLSLDKKHAYYYQVQTQLFVCDVEYADFCVCTFLKNGSNDYADEGIRITKDFDFWQAYVEKGLYIFLLLAYSQIC